MADLLPSSPDTSAAEQSSPRVVGLDSDDADDLLSALSSSTARDVLATLHEDPDTPSALADRVDTSLQNAQYHLENLHEAGLIEVIDTVYSEKGREMKVYAPADRPLVVFAGKESESTGLKTALTRLLGGFGVLVLLSAFVQWFLTDGPWFGLTGAGGAPGGQSGSDVTVATAEAAAGAAASGPAIPVGLVFLLGGTAVLLGAFAVWYLRR